ncbi:hypothetical protein [Nocardioides alcanivorans]|uniref:hypothetical protein n=1 Tax=Nocardioides alcanivorans TaxID=2897352 RepID=UPI001F19B4D7|nr:hypothetical protein [Nocardioides alcanivorans]
MSGHEIAWEFDRECVEARCVCTSPPDANCRLSCPDDCETYGEIIRHEDVTLDGKVAKWITHDDCRAVMQPGECNVELFLNEGGCIKELALGGPRFTIARTPIRPVWEGDFYEWEPIEEATP